MNKFTVQDFFKRFPDDNACLDHLMQTRFGETITCPKCKKQGKFHRIKKIPAYSCQWCGHHIHPMVDTPFQDSQTSLQKWFYAMYLFTTSRHGVPAKELQRQLGVTYKCAWRIGHEIRKYMGKVDGDAPLSGHVEIDETWVGGVKEGKGTGHAKASKTIVLGMVQRDGKAMTAIIPNIKTKTILPIVKRHVKKGSTISTDEWYAYRTLPAEGYNHGTVEHGMKQYVKGIHHTNRIEGFWSHLKRAIKGTHIHVSKKHLHKYLVEFEYRYNMRLNPWEMFSRLLASF